jgi:hypothetical protein
MISFVLFRIFRYFVSVTIISSGRDDFLWMFPHLNKGFCTTSPDDFYIQISYTTAASFVKK